ncbi:MAG TPA: MiaB/RimO family radical SAM methylthiotransferase [Tepidisphaeraceae bacterium]|jgi:threonylcarbamoyladenosine tRNA methylthiotransferase MtaB|nr:MiaB/RimO family radical SAM methylthiotransferase [Tepidisphaeraceae bacterium]
MKTFFVQTLGCKVNHYESDQIAELLQSRGLTPAGADSADLRIINTCSVTTQAASQSRQSVRRLHRLAVLAQSNTAAPSDGVFDSPAGAAPLTRVDGSRPRIIVTGCWATSNPVEAAAMAGVDAVLGHHHDLAWELDRLLCRWQNQTAPAPDAPNTDPQHHLESPRESLGIADNGKIKADGRVGQITQDIEPKSGGAVNRFLPNPATEKGSPRIPVHSAPGGGTVSLPLLGRRQPGRQRAYLKIQDGCDAHCTYCIIPSLRPNLWSKTVEQAVDEARALVDAGHAEIVLTGIFLGAYGQPTALRRRQPRPTAEPLGELIQALCSKVPGLRRLRLSSLEPGDLTPDLIAILRSYPQAVPHFHLPLQSGSDLLLRKMNRQYTRDDFLQMVDGIRAAFDRPALTTDIVVGFPGEDDAEFAETVDLVREAGFIHVHAFPYSPRPGTAAARWTEQFIRGPVVNERIGVLREIAEGQSIAFRKSFIGQTVEVIAERDSDSVAVNGETSIRHGRCERYFAVHFSGSEARPGDAVRVKIEQVDRERTAGVASHVSDIHLRAIAGQLCLSGAANV